jgi:hypothetical protein
MQAHDRERFMELAPFYAQGSLGVEDQQFVERCLAEDPCLQAEVEFHQALCSAVREESSVSEADLEAGYEIARRQWLDHIVPSSDAPEREGGSEPRPSLLSRLLAGLKSPRGWSLGTPAFALTFSVMMVLTVGVLWDSRSGPETQTFMGESEPEPGLVDQFRGWLPTFESSESDAAQTGSTLLRVTIDPDLPFGEVINLLGRVEATIVAGPSPSGELLLRLGDTQDMAAARKRLLGAEGVLDVVEVSE